MIVAQVATAAPEVAWWTFAPEAAVSAVAFGLMLLIVAGPLRTWAAAPLALAGLVGGVLLVANDQVVPGGVAIALAAGFIAITIGFGGEPRLVPAWLSALGLLGGLVLTGWQWVTEVAPADAEVVAVSAMQGSVAADGIALVTRVTVYLTALLVLPIGHGYLRERGIERPEFEPLLLLSVVGMAILGAANDLITVFVGLEILSIALYLLSGMARRDRRSQEAGIKYFVMGAVSSALLLYGMALTYTATGSVDLPVIGDALGVATVDLRLPAIGLALILVGLGFKVALVPFHLWTPDVYQGAPTNVTAFMAAATKAAGFAAVLRMLYVAFGSLEDLWAPIVAALATITMLYGAVGALVQRDVKRILAYSSLAHAGYAAIGVAAGSVDGLSGTLWYLLTYAVTTLAAFGALVAVERRRRGEVALVDLRGLGRTSPAIAAILTLSLLSLAGIPPTAGFVGKLTVFQAGVAAGLSWLVVVGVVSSVIAAFFYLRLMGTMFLEDPDERTETPVVSVGLSLGVSIAAALVIYLGVTPSFLLELVQSTAVLAR